VAAVVRLRRWATTSPRWWSRESCDRLGDHRVGQRDTGERGTLQRYRLAARIHHDGVRARQEPGGDTDRSRGFT
jgi:hypothetical protein